MATRLRTAVIVAVGFLAAVTWAACRAPAIRCAPSIDADRLAALELDMWQAYYRKERLRLFQGLVTMLHERARG